MLILGTNSFHPETEDTSLGKQLCTMKLMEQMHRDKNRKQDGEFNKIQQNNTLMCVLSAF